MVPCHIVIAPLPQTSQGGNLHAFRPQRRMRGEELHHLGSFSVDLHIGPRHHQPMTWGARGA